MLLAEMLGPPAGDNRREPTPSPGRLATAVSPSTQQDSLRPGDDLATAPLPLQRPRLVTKKSAQALDRHESDDSSDQEQRARSTAKIPEKSPRAAEVRRDPAPHFSAFHFPRIQVSSNALPSPSPRDPPAPDSARRSDAPGALAEQRRLSQDKSPSTAGPGSRQALELRSPGGQGFAAASQRGIALAEARRNSLGPGDAITPASASLKRDGARRSVHAMALLNAASGHEGRVQPPSLFRYQQEMRQNSALSLASLKSGKPLADLDPPSKDLDTPALGSRQPAPEDPQPARQAHQPRRSSARRPSDSLSKHHQSFDSSEG